MCVVTGFRHGRTSRAALARAIEEARHRDLPLIVVHSMRGSERDELERVIASRREFEDLTSELARAGIAHELVELARGNSPAEDIVAVARERDAALIVIGIRRRSAVGKLVLGSTAQQVLLEADCPVLAVKPPEAG
jgi:nucleotide-binding universal stress UspA family protein